MTILDKILFALDFTAISKNIEQVASSIAKTFNSTIIAMHALPDDIVNQKVKDLLDDTAQRRLNSFCEDLKDQGIKMKPPLIKYGHPHDAITMTASAINANMILVGSGENKAKEIYKLGTTTKRIIQRSSKPVLVIKEDDPFNIKTILCPVDFSEPSARALNNAIIMARRFNAHLVILSVAEGTSFNWFSSKEDLNKENADRLKNHKKKFNDFLKQFNLDNLNWSKELRTGVADGEILSTISEYKIDLLILGTNGRTGLNRMVLGSVTEKVIREVPCSFLTLKSQDVISLQLKEDIKDFETLHEAGKQLENDGLFEDAIELYKASLGINIMHVPAYVAIARIFDKLEQPEKAEVYRKSAMEIKEKFWNAKIEEELRKLRAG